MQTAVRKRAAVFDFWCDTPTPEFCENSHERGPRSPAGTAQGFDPPLGPHRSAAGTAWAVCAGVKRAAAHWRRCASAAQRERFSLGRRGQGAVPGGAAGASGTRGAGAFLPGGGGKPGTGGLGRVRRTKTAWRARRARGGHVAGRCGTGGFRGFPGRTRGRRGGQRARGGKAGAAARCRGAAGGGAEK